jgi:hypothetical protein
MHADTNGWVRNMRYSEVDTRDGQRLQPMFGRRLRVIPGTGTFITRATRLYHIVPYYHWRVKLCEARKCILTVLEVEAQGIIRTHEVQTRMLLCSCVRVWRTLTCSGQVAGAGIVARFDDVIGFATKVQGGLATHIDASFVQNNTWCISFLS